MRQLHLAPTQETADAIRKLVAKEDISVNAYLVPFLNKIAQGQLVRASHYLVGGHVVEVRPTSNR